MISKTHLFGILTVFLLTAISSVAEPISLDMDQMTSTELRSFKTEVEKAIDGATELPYDLSSKIEKDFKSVFEKKFVSSGATASYPFFGMDTSRERNLVTVSGNCTVRFADKSRKEYPMEGIYELKDNNTFELIALYSNEAIYEKNEGTLSKYNWMLKESQSITLGIDRGTRAPISRGGNSSAVEETKPVEGTTVDLNTESMEASIAQMSDEQLEKALSLVKAEQRARIKTKIVLEADSLILGKGKTKKISAEIVDVPEDIKASKLTWSSSDKKVATVSSGTVSAVDGGKAIITCSSSLSDGTIIEAECSVEVVIPVSTVSIVEKKITIGVDETIPLEVAVKPTDATYKELNYDSENPSVAVIDEQGNITGKGVGTTTITAKTTDGTEKTATTSVTVTMKDDIGVTKTDRDGHAVTLLGISTGKGSSYYKPESGNTFIFAEFQIENNTDEEESISSMLSFNAYCDSYKCDYSFAADVAAKNSLDGTIMPHKKMKGQIGLEVPSDWQELEIHVTPGNVWFGDTLVFTVYNQ